MLRRCLLGIGGVGMLVSVGIAVLAVWDAVEGKMWRMPDWRRIWRRRGGYKVVGEEGFENEEYGLSDEGSLKSL